MLPFRQRPRRARQMHHRDSGHAKLGRQRSAETGSAERRRLMLARCFDAAFNALYGCTALLMLARLVSGAAFTGPVAQVGDMVDFGAWRSSSFGIPRLIVAARVVGGGDAASSWAPAGNACRLDVVLMTKLGSALTVLAVRPDGVLLSWAGTATSRGAGDCAPNKTILVDDADYQRLAAAQVGNPAHR